MRKHFTTLGDAVTTTAFFGGIAGALVGAGVEDALSHAYLSQHALAMLEWLSVVTAGLGALGGGVLGALQFKNRDPHERTLMKEEYCPRPLPLTEDDLGAAVNAAFIGVNNTGLARVAYTTVTNLLMPALNRDPFATIRRKYSDARNNFLANQFDVFVPFTYGNRTIDPDERMDRFVKNGSETYALIMDHLVQKTIAMTTGTVAPQLEPEIRECIVEEIAIAQDLGLWATYLSHREGIVGSQARQKLGQYGIEHPDALANDIEAIGENLLSLYDRLTKRQPPIPQFFWPK